MLGEGKQTVAWGSLVEHQNYEKSPSSIILDGAPVLCAPEPFGSHSDTNLRLLRETRGYDIARRQLIDPPPKPEAVSNWSSVLHSAVILSRYGRFWMSPSAHSH